MTALDELPTDLKHLVQSFARERTTAEIVLMLKGISDSIVPERDGFTQEFFKWCLKEHKPDNGRELVTWIPQGPVERRRLHRAYKFCDWLTHTFLKGGVSSRL